MSSSAASGTPRFLQGRAVGHVSSVQQQRWTGQFIWSCFLCKRTKLNHIGKLIFDPNFINLSAKLRKQKCHKTLCVFLHLQLSPV
jgi:hypothetical protein